MTEPFIVGQPVRDHDGKHGEIVGWAGNEHGWAVFVEWDDGTETTDHADSLGYV